MPKNNSFDSEAARPPESPSDFLNEVVKTSPAYSKKQQSMLVAVAGLWLLVVLLASGFFAYWVKKFEATSARVEELEKNLSTLSTSTQQALETAGDTLRLIQGNQRQADERLKEFNVTLESFESRVNKTTEKSKAVVEAASRLLSKTEESYRAVTEQLDASQAQFRAAESASKSAAATASEAIEKADQQEKRFKELEQRLNKQLQKLEATVFRAGSYLLETNDPNPLITLGLKIFLRDMKEGRLQDIRIFALNDLSCQLWPIDKDARPCVSRNLGTLELGQTISFVNKGGTCRFRLTPTFYHKHRATTDLVGVDVSWTDEGEAGSCKLVAFGAPGR